MKGKRVKKLNKALLSLLLSAVMLAEPAAGAAVTYAAEPVSGQAVDFVEDASEKEEQDTSFEAEGGKEENNSDKDGGEEGSSEEIGRDEDSSGETDDEQGGAGETGYEEGNSEETGSEEGGSEQEGFEETGDGQDETGEEGFDEEDLEESLADEEIKALEEEEPEDTDKEEEEDKDNWQGTGHKAPELEMQLTSAMVSEKIELQGTADRLEVLEKNVQYVANEAVFLASSKKYAETVAEGYGASLESYEDGVAVMTFPDEVTDIIAMAEDEKVKLPAVYPNYYYTTCNDIVVYSDAVPIEDDNVAMAVNNNDPLLNSSAGNGYQYYHEEIHSTAAWNYNNAAGAGIKVAVIDSGIQKNHEDLKGRVASAGVTYSTPYNKAEDNNGHGTHVSGIIAATGNNNKGGAGIAYKATITSYKALEENPATGGAGGSTAGIIKAVNASVKSGARVINMSLGGNYYDSLFEATVDTAVSKGVVVVAAAGNEGLELSKTKGDAKYYSPACFDNVITVSAKQKGAASLASFSNYGAGVVDITAPGTSIASSVPNDYKLMSGTSQATPMVAAAAAYIFSVSPDLKNNKTKSAVDTVKRILQDSATKANYSDSSKFGAGLLNVEAAVKMAAPSASNGGTGELTAPAVKIGANDVVNNAIIQDTDLIILSATVGGAANSEVKIYYTLDGKAPTEKSTLYEGPFSVEASGSKTIKAVAVYYGKKSAVTSLKVKVNANMTDFSITSKTNSVYLGARKTLNLAVDAKSVVPSYATNKTVTWEIVDYGKNNLTDAEKASIAAINSKGQLKAAATIASKTTITVRATAKDGGGATGEISITLLPKAEKLELTAPTLEGKAPYQLIFDTAPGTVQMEVTVTPTDANTGISYTSSNAKVASVNDDGLITAVGNGQTTITAKTTDGSNKKTTLKVQVTKKVQSVKVTSKTGEAQLAAGKTLQMVAEVTSDATNKQVKWSISEGSAATINEKNGKLTAKSNSEVAAVSTVKVKAEALDGSGKYDEMSITVYPSITGKIAFEETEAVGASCSLGTTNKGDLHTSIQLHPYTENHTSTFFGRAKGTGSTGLDNFIYTSSNKKIAEVSSTGLVTVNANGKTGTVKIKAAARDGSGKSASYTVKVVKPVTSLYIYSKTGSIVVGRGKKLTLGASVGGNASNKKLEWTSSNTSIATVDKNGKVKGISYDPTKLESMVTITAEATDGSGVKASYKVWVQPAITKLMFETNAGGYAATVKETYQLSDVPKAHINNSNINDYLYYCLEIYGFNTPYYFDESSGSTYRKFSDASAYWDWYSVSCICSNSNVIQIVDVPIKQEDGSVVYYSFMIPVNKGKATITFKALDGSGKSAKLNITVK